MKPRELSRWVAATRRAARHRLDSGPPRALVAQVGDRRQRLLRELEKLALEPGSGARSGSRRSRRPRHLGRAEVWTLVDALVSRDGARRRAPARAAQPRRAAARAPVRHGPRRLRDALAVAEALAAGQPCGAGQAEPCGCLSFAADRLVSDVAGSATWRRSGARSSSWRISRSKSRGGAGGVLSEDTVRRARRHRGSALS